MYAKGIGPPNRNFWLGVYNGILINGAEAFFHSTLVLAPFLFTLGAPAFIIGSIPALRVGGWFLPQLFVASRLAHQPFKLPWYRRMTLVRVVAYVLMVLTVFLFAERAFVVMVMVLIMIALVSVANGISGIPFADVTAKVVPHYRLGTYWALRNAIGGVLALLSGLLLRRLLSGDNPFPQNFGVIFAIGAALSTVSYLSFCLVREPAGQITIKQPFRRMIRRIPDLLRQDVSFRRYIRVRFLAMLAVLADPFYAVYALSELGAPTSSLGLFVILATASSIIANLVFRTSANKGRNVDVLQIGIALLFTTSLAALLLPSWQSFSLVFMLSAAGQAGMNIAAWNLLYAVSPDEDRLLYVGTANSLLSLPSLAPIAGGLLTGVIGLRSTFVLAAALALTALGFAFRFRELRDLDRQALERSNDSGNG
ncbi:MAG: MFS transporter [Trueperaceae bacterium]|nr:MAG: MFS transporter [Trueperaceae bacterium]